MEEKENIITGIHSLTFLYAERRMPQHINQLDQPQYLL
jgi:hypothetical protein